MLAHVYCKNYYLKLKNKFGNIYLSFVLPYQCDLLRSRSLITRYWTEEYNISIPKTDVIIIPIRIIVFYRLYVILQTSIVPADNINPNTWNRHRFNLHPSGEFCLFL